MNEQLYKQIIQKQNELISLLLGAGLDFSEVPLPPVPPGAKVEYHPEQITFDKTGFATHLKKQGRSQNTIDTYVTTMKLYFDEFKILSADNLEKYEEQIQQFAPRTINLKICAMDAYFKFVGFTNYNFVRVKEQTRTFCDNAINEEQYNKLINWAAENNHKSWLIAKVIASTGVRVSELVSLKTESLKQGYADITSKGNKSRRIYFPKSLVEEIKDKCGDVYIVENINGQQYSTRGVDAVLKRAGKFAGIPKEVMHPHSFRHFFAKQFLKNKNDISLLGDLLGHRDLSTTSIYTRMTSEEQKREIEKIINW